MNSSIPVPRTAQQEATDPRSARRTRRRLIAAVLIIMLSSVLLAAAVFIAPLLTDSDLAARAGLQRALAIRDLERVDEFAAALLNQDPADAEAHQAILWAALIRGDLASAQVQITSYMIASGGIVGYTIDTIRQIAAEGHAARALDSLALLIDEIKTGTGFAVRWRQVSRNGLGRLQDTALYNAHVARGDIFDAAGNVLSAADEYRAAAAALPMHFFGYEKLVRYLYTAGDINGALEALTDGERHGALSLMFYVRLAQEYFFANEPDDWTLALLDRSHQYDNIPYYGWFVEGCVYLRAGQTDSAAAAMQEWKARRPNDQRSVGQLMDECANTASPLYWRVDPQFVSSPNYYGLEQ